MYDKKLENLFMDIGAYKVKNLKKSHIISASFFRIYIRRHLSFLELWGKTVYLPPLFRFLKEEPNKLENLVSRCKHITGTLFTLQK